MVERQQAFLEYNHYLDPSEPGFKLSLGNELDLVILVDELYPEQECNFAPLFLISLWLLILSGHGLLLDHLRGYLGSQCYNGSCPT